MIDKHTKEVVFKIITGSNGYNIANIIQEEIEAIIDKPKLSMGGGIGNSWL